MLFMEKWAEYVAKRLTVIKCRGIIYYGCGSAVSEETNAVIGVVAFSYIDRFQLNTDDYAICIDYLKPLLEKGSIEYRVYGHSGVALWLRRIQNDI